MKIIDQPLSRGRNRVFLLYFASDGAIGIQQDASVVHDTGKKRTAPGSFLRDGLCRRKTLGVLLEPFQAEEFSAYRLFRIRKKNGRRLIRAHYRNQRLRCGKCPPAPLPYPKRDTEPHLTPERFSTDMTYSPKSVAANEVVELRFSNPCSGGNGKTGLRNCDCWELVSFGTLLLSGAERLDVLLSLPLQGVVLFLHAGGFLLRRLLLFQLDGFGNRNPGLRVHPFIEHD
jgi:hypothetical protein